MSIGVAAAEVDKICPSWSALTVVVTLGLVAVEMKKDGLQAKRLWGSGPKIESSGCRKPRRTSYEGEALVKVELW